MGASTGLCRALVAQPPPPVLGLLGAELKFEMAVGANGRVWINSASIRVTVLVANALQKCDRVPPVEQEELVNVLLAAYRADIA